MEPRDILGALEGELRFYRKRLFTVFTYCLLLEALLVVSRVSLHSTNEGLTNAAYTFVLVVIVLFMFRFHDSYVSRIYRIRWERNEFSKSEERPEGQFPLPFGGHFRPGSGRSWWVRVFSGSPSMQYVYVVKALAILGVVLVWTV